MPWPRSNNSSWFEHYYLIFVPSTFGVRCDVVFHAHRAWYHDLLLSLRTGGYRTTIIILFFFCATDTASRNVLGAGCNIYICQQVSGTNEIPGAVSVMFIRTHTNNWHHVPGTRYILRAAQYEVPNVAHARTSCAVSRQQ